MTMNELDLRAKDGGVVLRLRVQPRASKDAIGGLRDGALVVRVTAPPVEGTANAAVIKLIAKVLERPPSSIALLHGSKGRDKTLHVAGIEMDEMRAKLLACVR
jgi:uncharacterized protein (TIGR00251 family)